MAGISRRRRIKHSKQTEPPEALDAWDNALSIANEHGGYSDATMANLNAERERIAASLSAE